MRARGTTLILVETQQMRTTHLLVSLSFFVFYQHRQKVSPNGKLQPDQRQLRVAILGEGNHAKCIA